MRALASLALVASCGFHPGKAAPDGGPGDAPDAPAIGDAALDAPAATGCWGRWLDHTVRFAAPQSLATINSTAFDRDPFLAPDELSVFVSSIRTMALGSSDIWVATRASTAVAFDAPTLLLTVSSTGGESKFSFTANGLYGVVGSDRTGGKGAIDVWETSRASAGDPWGVPVQTHLGQVNTADADHDPTISADGLHVYLAPATGTQHLAVASRSSLTKNFSAPAAITELDSGTGDADPTVSADERVIVFSSNRTGAGVSSGNMWYAVRAVATDPFGTPMPVPDVNSDSANGDPHLSADGCRLYFSSDRTAGQDWDVFVASVQ